MQPSHYTVVHRGVGRDAPTVLRTVASKGVPSNEV